MASVNIPNDSASSNEHSILFRACENGDLRTLEKSLKSYSSSNITSIRDQQGATLVHYAARYGHLHILEYFVEKKRLDISKLQTEHGATCLHDAAVCDQVEIVDYILHHQKKGGLEKLLWNSTDGQGNSPLHLASAYGSIRTVRYFLEHESADPHIRSYNGFRPIHYASSSGHGNCLKLLLSIAPDTVNEQSTALMTPLYLACQYGSMEPIKILSSYGASFQIRDENGLHCLHTACQSSHLHVVQWLVESQNADVNAVDYSNNSPLHYAAASGNQAILTYLLDKGARIVTSRYGNTPLHMAAENGHQSACTTLIEQGGCLVTATNSSQLTAADLAIHHGFQSLANELNLRVKTSSIGQTMSENSQKIQVENATIVRLVVKKRNVPRTDASNQVDEVELSENSQSNEPNSVSSQRQINQRFDLSELRARVEEHEAIRRDPSYLSDNVLMHSMDSLNQLNRNPQRSKLPTQTYAPWLKMGNMTSQAFQQEIQRVGTNLRKVRRDSLLRADLDAYEQQSRQSQSVDSPKTSSTKYDPTTNPTRKSNGLEQRPKVNPTSKSHQFIANSQSGSSSVIPEWQRDLIDRRRAAGNGVTSQS